MVREFRSMTASGKSGRSTYLPYLVYGLVAVIFGLTSAQLRQRGGFLGSLTPYLYLIAIFIAFMLLRFWRRENELRSASNKPWHHDVSVVLDKLSDEYLLLAGVKIAAKNNARWEIDYLIVGPNGVFVLEIRTEAGEITVSSGEPHWIVTRKGKRNNVVNKTIFNPLLTVSEKSTVVKEILAAHQVETIVSPLVVFLDNATTFSDRSLPVVTLDNTVQYIKNIPTEQKLDNYKRKSIARLF